MAVIDPKELFIISKLCGKFGSDHDGEITGAAKMAHKRLNALGLTWDDLLLSQLHAPQSEASRAPGHKEKIKYCRDNLDLLREREQDFIESIFERVFYYGRPLTSKQEKWLNGIYDRVGDA